MSQPVRVLGRSAHWIAVDKPTGLPTRPAPSHASSLLAQLEKQLAQETPPLRPGVVHRLDLGTTGVVLFSLSAEGHRALVQAFRERKARKRYLAIVLGRPRTRRGTIDLKLRKNASGRVVPDGRGLPASTRYETLARTEAHALVAAEPRTGRMHQIRAHFAALGFPVAGDERYGPRTSSPGARAPRLMLHAAAIEIAGLELTGSSGVVALEAPVPDDFRAYATALAFSPALLARIFSTK